MKSPEYIAHGTTSEKDAENIQEEGFIAQEGRATLSGDLIYAFDWATKQERRKGSKSETEIVKEEKGRIIIMKVPEGMSANYATHTDIEIDENAKEISGYPSKYESGRKQIGIYISEDIDQKKTAIELAKREIQEIGTRIDAFLRENNIDPTKIGSKEDLLQAIQSFDIEKRIEILKKAEELEIERGEKRKEAEPSIKIDQENILMSIVATPELGKKLEDLQEKIRKLETTDLEIFTIEVSKIIEDNKQNFLASGLDVHEIVGNLLTTTMEAEVMSMIRSLFIDLKRVQGFEVYNRGKDELKEKAIHKDEFKQKLERIKAIVDDEKFDIGVENLNRYLKINVDRMLRELSS